MTPTLQEITEAETWAEYEKQERQRKRQWLQAHADRHETVSALAKAIGRERCSLHRTAKALGVTLPSERAPDNVSRLALPKYRGQEMTAHDFARIENEAMKRRRAAG